MTEAQGDWVLVPRELGERAKDYASRCRSMLPVQPAPDTILALLDDLAAAPANPLLADLVAACLEWARVDAAKQKAKAAWAAEGKRCAVAFVDATEAEEGAADHRDDAARALGRHLLAQQEGK